MQRSLCAHRLINNCFSFDRNTAAYFDAATAGGKRGNNKSRASTGNISSVVDAPTALADSTPASVVAAVVATTNAAAASSAAAEAEMLVAASEGSDAWRSFVTTFVDAITLEPVVKPAMSPHGVVMGCVVVVIPSLHFAL